MSRSLSGMSYTVDERLVEVTRDIATVFQRVDQTA
jgi:hypothetical protein